MQSENCWALRNNQKSEFTWVCYNSQPHCHCEDELGGSYGRHTTRCPWAEWNKEKNEYVLQTLVKCMNCGKEASVETHGRVSWTKCCKAGYLEPVKPKAKATPDVNVSVKVEAVDSCVKLEISDFKSDPPIAMSMVMAQDTALKLIGALYSEIIVAVKNEGKDS